MTIPLDQKLDPATTALIIVDVQNDFCSPEGTLASLGVDMTESDRAIDHMEQLLHAAREAGVAVIHLAMEMSEHSESPPWMDVRMRRSPQRPRWCAPGSWGAQFHRIEPLPDEPVIRKHRYSGFVGTRLELLLRSKQ